MRRTLDIIVELQGALDDLRSAEELIEGVPEWMRELHEEYSERKAHLDGIRSAIEEAAAERRGAEAGAADMNEKLRHFQEQIGAVRNQREYAALLQEIDGAKRQIKAFEDQALEALQSQEEEEARLREEEEEFQELDERYQAELVKWEAEKPQVAHRAEEARSAIETLEKELPPPILARFRMIFDRFDGRALAPVQSVERPGRSPEIWHCGVCNYRVRPQSVVEIQDRGNVVLCDSCKRVLYLEEAAD